MKIISIRQPWAYLVVNGLKDVENRTWRTRYRGPVVIHTSQTPDQVSLEEMKRRFGVRPPDHLPLGVVVGIADIVDCVMGHPSKWYVAGHWAFVLRNARPVTHVKWSGALSLRDVPQELRAIVDFEHGLVA
jgi:hypothetical protein